MAPQMPIFNRYWGFQKPKEENIFRNLPIDFQGEIFTGFNIGSLFKIIIILTPKNETFLAILHFLIHLFRNENKVLGTY
ncbi:hypothetical protein CRS_29390 [Chryseobacterium sp. ON_d1]|nr:hypothetical protein CRS_29390 [Chryseobacterium sp. ON_d1]